MTKWQPIESAPMDERILVWCAYLEDTVFAEIRRPDGVVTGYDDSHYVIDRPTHWMPLPEPPTS
ncbi:DUF551 domain-containing protein [Agrobacterium pusense]|uniref:DUF551 domain-containing protein n=1 Tax=Agrobacterium pusense TaxID=648995 RepID=A0A6H0ZJJ9_9HYPH|nr:DUF551 domain-containing protein [Agrobacterium pusense]QIX20227.1 DUF551 domain-containing protein [Agrobacterium pusense]